MRDLIFHIECQWFFARVCDGKGILSSAAYALVNGISKNREEITEEINSRMFEEAVKGYERTKHNSEERKIK